MTKKRGRSKRGYNFVRTKRSPNNAHAHDAAVDHANMLLGRAKYFELLAKRTEYINAHRFS